MEILVAILIIALIAAVVFALVQRRHASAPGVKRPGTLPIARRGRTVSRRDPMAAAVADHAQATDPADVVAAEQRMQAEARNVSARMQGGAPAAGYQPVPDQSGYQPAPGQAGYEVDDQTGYQPAPGQAAPAAYQPAPGQASPTGPAVPYATDPSLDDHFDPTTGERLDAPVDPADDPRLHDRRYDGRLAADYVDPREDDRLR